MTEPSSTHRRAMRWAACLVFVPLASCYSIAGYRVERRMVTEDRAVVLALWCQDQVSLPENGDAWALWSVGALLWWPVDVVVSAISAVQAPFEEAREVRGGLPGAVAAICLPWLTVGPQGLIAPSYRVESTEDLQVGRAEFEQLLARVRAGDGVEACRELAGFSQLRDIVYAVEVLEESGR